MMTLGRAVLCVLAVSHINIAYGQAERDGFRRGIFSTGRATHLSSIAVGPTERRMISHQIHINPAHDEFFTTDQHPRLAYIIYLQITGPYEENCTTPLSESGACINIRECPVLMDMLRKVSQNPEVVNYLRQSTCWYVGKDPIVCCPQAAQTTTGATTRWNVTTTGATTLPSLQVCGKIGAEVKKIVGGSPADLGLFRWITALGYRSPRHKAVSWLCAGSLVTDRHVITAAHCVVAIARNFVLSVARLGDLDLNDNVRDGATPTDYEVEMSLPYPGYNASMHVNDIAIVRLKKSVTFTDLIVPICLPILKEFRTKDFTGYSPYITGWGATQHRGGDLKTTHLQQAQVQVTNQEYCRDAYRKVEHTVIDNSVVCAADNGKDACQGDSGGPLMLPRGRNGNFYLYGIVSYGFKCAEPGYPGIYARVSEFVDWILLNLK